MNPRCKCQREVTEDPECVLCSGPTMVWAWKKECEVGMISLPLKPEISPVNFRTMMVKAEQKGASDLSSERGMGSGHLPYPCRVIYQLCLLYVFGCILFLSWKVYFIQWYLTIWKGCSYMTVFCLRMNMYKGTPDFWIYITR